MKFLRLSYTYNYFVPSSDKCMQEFSKHFEVFECKGSAEIDDNRLMNAILAKYFFIAEL